MMTKMTNNTTPRLPAQSLAEPVPAAVSRRTGIIALVGGVFTLVGCGGSGGGGGIGSGAAGGVDLNVGASGIGPGDSGGGATTGGDTNVAGVSSGGTGSTSGSVTGFGSIYLNGSDVRIDDATATLTDEDGVDKKGLLRLGMHVTVTSKVSAAGDVTALSIVISSELLGRIDGAPNNNLQSFEVLGQTVRVVGGTVFDTSFPGGFASLTSNDLVEVHGFLDASRNEITATFIEKKDSAPYFKIQGLVKSLNSATKEFRIGNLNIGYSATPPAQLQVSPANGGYVRARLNPALPAAGVWQATRISGPQTPGQTGNLSEIEGRISAFVSATSFSVDGIVVLTNIATTFPNGAVTAAEVGRWVEVKGVTTAGGLVAMRVKLENDVDLDTIEYRLTGNLSGLAIPTPSNGTFVLRGYTVQFADAGGAQTLFDQGIIANLINGAQVEVRGNAFAGLANTLLARRIKFL